MKISILATGLMISSFAFAFQPGEYNCGNSENQYSYKIKSLDLNGTSVPYLEVNSAEAGKTHTIKGIATQFTNSEGYDVLVLGNVTLELHAGRPTCGNNN